MISPKDDGQEHVASRRVGGVCDVPVGVDVRSRRADHQAQQDGQTAHGWEFARKFFELPLRVLRGFIIAY